MNTSSRPATTRHRIGRFLLTALTGLADRMIRPSVLIPLMGLLATWAGFEINAGLYMRAALSPAWYDATLIVVLLLPPLTGHLTAWASGHRSGFWWMLWVPALALYWLRPWHTGTEWALFWREHLDLREYLVQILRQQEQAPLRAFIRLGGGLTMALVTFMVLARSWLRFTAWLQELGREAGEGSGTAGAGRAEGLPQATWASAGEVRDTFSHKGGIVLGEHTDPLEGTPGFDPDRRRSWKGQGKGRLITMNPALGNGHVVVLAASAGYKTAGLVIPNILHYDNPLVVIDPKGDLYARTRAAREARGFTARVIDARHGFDPFRMIAPLAPEAPSVYLTMARTLMPLSDRASDISEYFHEMATALFAALMGHFIAENSTNVAAAISKFINRERDVVIEEARNIALQHNFPFITDEMEGLAALDARTFPGVVKGISNKLAFTRFPDAAAYSQSSDSADSHLAALGPKSDIFINFPTLAANDFASFPRLLIGAMYVASELIEQPDRPRARRLFLIDEARVLGGMEALNNIRDAGRSIGLHLMLIYQNYGQLTKAWGGEAGAAAWLDICEARVISAVGSSRTASDIVTMLGRRTLRTRVQGSSASSPVMVPMGGTVSSSEQEQLREVPLMSAATLGQLPAHGALIFTRRSKPILATKAIFFTRPDMAPLVRSPDAVAGELDATRRRTAVMEKMQERQMQNLPDPQPGLRLRSRGKTEENGTDAAPEPGLETASPPHPVGGTPPPETGIGTPGETRTSAAAARPEQAAHARQALPAGTRAPDMKEAPAGEDWRALAETLDPDRFDFRTIPDYRIRLQVRIAAALAQKARKQTKAAEAQNPEQEEGGATASNTDAKTITSNPHSGKPGLPGDISTKAPNPARAADITSGPACDDETPRAVPTAARAPNSDDRQMVVPEQAEGTAAISASRDGTAPDAATPLLAETGAVNGADRQADGTARTPDAGNIDGTPPAPDGLAEEDRAMMARIMGALENRPALRAAVSRALAGNTAPDPDGKAPDLDASGKPDAGRASPKKTEPRATAGDDMNQNAESHSIEAGDPAAPEHSRSAGKTDSSTPTANKKTKPETAGPQEQPDVDADPFDVEIEAAMKMLWPGTARRRPKKAGPRGAAPKTRPGDATIANDTRPGGASADAQSTARDATDPEESKPGAEQPDNPGTGDAGLPDAKGGDGPVETRQPDPEATATGVTARTGMESDLASSAESAAPDRSDPPTATPSKSAGATGRAKKKPASPAQKKAARKPDAGAKRRRALDADAVREAFDPHIEGFFRACYGEPARPGSDDWRPRGRTSFSLERTGPKRGCWYDHAAGKGGSLFDLVAIQICDLPDAQADFPRVLEAAAEFAGYAPSGETPKTRKARKRRKAEQTDKAREEARQKAEETAMLVLALRGLAQPVAGSPAQAWLASRRITAWPGTGLGFLPALDNTLPDPLRLQIYSPEYPALVVWACADDGTITGGQRILLDDAGKAAQTDPGKPSFGLLSGCPARFPARDGTGDGPLLVAEGPETALTLWLATGYESRAVFGVSGWKTAPLPTDREILLAPDRDAAPSPAGIAFRKAVAHHLARGCRLRIAPAPEPEGSKKDLNDTAMEQGLDAVRAALGAAHPPGPDDLPDDLPDETHAATAEDGEAGEPEPAARQTGTGRHGTKATTMNGGVDNDTDSDTDNDDERSTDQSDPGGTA